MTHDLLGPLAPRPGDRFVWLVAEDADEPLLVGYAESGADAVALAETVDGPVIMWRAGKEGL